VDAVNRPPAPGLVQIPPRGEVRHGYGDIRIQRWPRGEEHTEASADQMKPQAVRGQGRHAASKIGMETTEVGTGIRERTGGCRWVDRQEQQHSSTGENKERKPQGERVRMRERE